MAGATSIEYDATARWHTALINAHHDRKEGTALRSVCVMLLVAVAAALCIPSEAQDPVWTATIGLDGTARGDSWAPVLLQAQNQGSARDGKLTVQSRSSRDDRLLTSHTLAFDLPAASTKDYGLCTYIASANTPYLQLPAPAGWPPAKEEVNQSVDDADTLMVIVGGPPSYLGHLAGSRLPGTHRGSASATLRIAHIAWERLPGTWLAWDSVDGVMLGDAAVDTASDTSLEALLDWVKLGGMLIVPGGTHSPALGTGPLAPVLPLSISGTGTLADLDGLNAWSDKPIMRQPTVVAGGAPREGARVLCGSEREPLICEMRLGAGRVVMFAFDPAAAPVRSWDGLDGVFSRVLAFSDARVSLTTGREADATEYGLSYGLGRTAAQTARGRLPSVSLIIGFLLVYLIVLSPVQYAVLKRLDRRELAWVVTPLIVLFFAGAAYGTGQFIRGSTIIVNRIGVIETLPDQSLARGRGYVGIFSPHKAPYTLRLGDGAVGLRDVLLSRRTPASPMTIDHTSGAQTVLVQMNMWTMRTFCTEFTTDLGRGISGYAVYDGNALKADITNNMGCNLKGVRVVSRAHGGPPADLAAGQQREFTYVPHGASSIVPVSPYSQSGSGRRGSPPEQPEMAEMALAALFSDSGWTPYGPSEAAGLDPARDRVWLAAVSQEPVVPLTIDKASPSYVDRNIIIVRLPVQLPAGKSVDVPPWLIQCRMLQVEGQWSADTSGTTVLALENGSVVFEYDVPVGPQSGVARRLVLSFSAADPDALGGMGGPSMGGPPEAPFPGMGMPGAVVPDPASDFTAAFHAYSFAEKRWVPTGTDENTIVLEPARDMMSRDGRVYVAVKVGKDKCAFSIPELKAEVEAH